LSFPRQQIRHIKETEFATNVPLLPINIDGLFDRRAVAGWISPAYISMKLDPWFQGFHDDIDEILKSVYAILTEIPDFAEDRLVKPVHTVYLSSSQSSVNIKSTWYFQLSSPHQVFYMRYT
jgi:hypothetical protein